MATEDCPRCREKELAHLRLLHGNDPTISIDVKGMSFACKIPIYEYDSMGRPVVKIWNCELKRELTYSQAEFERKRAVGEI